MLSYLASHNGCVPTGHLHIYYMFKFKKYQAKFCIKNKKKRYSSTSQLTMDALEQISPYILYVQIQKISSEILYKK